jgi:DNA-binding MarR family transcriptional regulator
METLEVLRDGPTTPSEIADRQDVPNSHVSRALKELREKNIVNVHGTESRSRIYQLTEQGHDVLDVVDDIGGAD